MAVPKAIKEGLEIVKLKIEVECLQEVCALVEY